MAEPRKMSVKIEMEAANLKAFEETNERVHEAYVEMNDALIALRKATAELQYSFIVRPTETTEITS